MLRWTKSMGLVAGLILMLGLQQTRAQDQPMPIEGKATVTVTVVDADGKPVSGAKVSIIPGSKNAGKSKAATTQPGGQAPGSKPAPLQTGTTGDDGTLALTKIPDGSYSVTARLQGQGNGRAKVIVVDGKDEAVSITLKPHQPKPTTNK